MSGKTPEEAKKLVALFAEYVRVTKCLAEEPTTTTTTNEEPGGCGELPDLGKGKTTMKRFYGQQLDETPPTEEKQLKQLTGGLSGKTPEEAKKLVALFAEYVRVTKCLAEEPTTTTPTTEKPKGCGELPDVGKDKMALFAEYVRVRKCVADEATASSKDRSSLFEAEKPEGCGELPKIGFKDKMIMKRWYGQELDLEKPTSEANQLKQLTGHPSNKSEEEAKKLMEELADTSR